MKSNFTLTQFIFKKRLLIALVLAALILLLQNCSKNGPTPTEDLYQQYFEQNVLNSDFVVSLADDNGTIITSQYTGWVFKLFKNTYYDGPMTAIKNGVTYTGTWTCSADYGKLTISLIQPTVATEFIFLNRSWRFTKKELPVMEFAPWGSTAPTKLFMRRL
jgi:hypothetical protein